MEIIQRFRSAAKLFFVQLELHGHLAKVEWEEEKNRLQQLIAFSLLAFACLICSMVFFGILIIAATWATEYRILSIGAVVLIYLAGLTISYFRLKKLLALGSATFAATRAEIASDIELIRSRL